MKRNKEKEEQLIKLIDQFRSDIDEEFIITDLNEPCQLEMFWTDSPFEHQILFVTKDSNRPDREVIVNGPYAGDKYYAKMDLILEEPRWKQPVEESGYLSLPFDQSTGMYLDPSVRRELIVPILQRFSQFVGTEVYSENRDSVILATRMVDEDWCMFIRGNPDNDTLSQFINPSRFLNGNDDDVSKEGDSVGEDDSENSDLDDDDSERNEMEYCEESDESEDIDLEDLEDEVEEEAEKLIEEMDEATGYGTYFFEPIWIGELPDLDFEERVLCKSTFDYDNVLSEQFGETLICVRQDGLIAVDNSVEKNEALGILNTIFGASMFADKSFQAATINDLIEVTFSDDQIESTWGLPSITRQAADLNYSANPYTSRTNPTPDADREVVDVESIKKIIDIAKDIYENNELKERINSTLQAHTHHKNGEYSQAFLLGWIAIEQYLNTHLDVHLKNNQGVNSNRRNKMTDSPNWTSTHKIELLELSGAIKKSEYTKIDQLRKKRNNVVHEMENVTESESEELVAMACYLIEDELNNDAEEDIVMGSL